ncbi:MAG: hypothetical protein APG12_01490 [Candidatus Methanofastidiosum methylothiophilum]|uniref:Uncharacterized protein n=1 Tax=Candidatus Methanofastidiosum methylothiophilum TaxID=1705564 RepID=A0A150IJ62_9EURY|nr:MAG: hypothetical protein APG10_01242 [Candidatus Methanofastidiosum methylthiophilus]KYC47774.1 MAG: hypothetical protein APG11_00852 [Candidatus Methanofastidiosum methylthiophilus]KYC49402.1 MAG: hypothetical protein APG12_01490 [Candidatus Methanofastidiosum methylthiophilus]
MAPFGRIEMTTDVDISDQLTNINNQIFLSEAPQTIVFNTSIPKSIITQVQMMYQDSNTSWKEVIVDFDPEVANARFSIDTEGKRNPSGYRFMVNYRINTSSIYTLKPNTLLSFEYFLINKLGEADTASINLTLPEGFKPLNSLGWRVQDERFVYSSQISKTSGSFYTIFNTDNDYSDSLESLKKEIANLRQDNSRLSETIIELQKSVESYKTENQTLSSEVESLNNRLLKAEEERKTSERISNNFWQFSWGLTILLPILLLFFAELRTKSVITSTQLLISSVVGTFVVFLILYILFIT